MHNNPLIQLLGSTASNRAYVLASHISPIVQQLFLNNNVSDCTRNNNNDPSLHEPTTAVITNADFENNNQNEEQSRAMLHHWIQQLINEELCLDQQEAHDCRRLRNEQKDSRADADASLSSHFFDRFIKTCKSNDHEQHPMNDCSSSLALSLDQLTQNDLIYLLKQTMRAIDSKRMDAHRIQALNLQRTQLMDRNQCSPLLHSMIPKCHSLTSVNLSHLTHVVNDETMECLGRYLPHLTNIIVDHCEHVTDNGCMRLLQWIHSRNAVNALQSINLSHTSITERTLYELVKYITNNNDCLSTLDCDGINVCHALAVMLLTACIKLNKIGYGECNSYSKFRQNVVLKLPNSSRTRASDTVEIDLSDTMVTNDILKNVLAVYASPSLRRLSLRGATRLNDSVVTVFGRFANKLPNLQMLDLDETNLSPLAKQHIYDMLRRQDTFNIY